MHQVDDMAPQFYFAMNTINRSKLSVDQLLGTYPVFRLMKKLEIYNHDYI